MTRILKTAVSRLGFAALPILCLLALPAGVFGSEDEVTIVGVIGEVGGADGSWVVNERQVGITGETEYFNHKEKTIPLQDFKPGKWIFGIGHAGESGGLTLDKVYLLPGPFKGKDRSSYPFMNRDDDGSGEPSKERDRGR